MDKFVVEGGIRLEGELQVSGAKNSALPALAACLLTSEPVVLRRIPPVRDVLTMKKLLASCGALIRAEGDALRVEAGEIRSVEAPYELVKTMRASSLVLGPLTARTGRARVSMPGGCAIGARPINLHLAGLEHLGAKINTEHGYVEAEASKVCAARRFISTESRSPAPRIS
jgi:UDP-N-acetylglucosamine 1-carboxyvinyltransferase